MENELPHGLTEDVHDIARALWAVQATLSKIVLELHRVRTGEMGLDELPRED